MVRGFLTVTGRTAETAPTYALLAYQHGQDFGIDYRAGHIIQEVVVGRHSPTFALRTQETNRSGNDGHRRG